MKATNNAKDGKRRAKNRNDGPKAAVSAPPPRGNSMKRC